MGAAGRAASGRASTARSSRAAWANGQAFLHADRGPARAAARGWSSGRAPPRRPATRWCRPTSASTTCGCQLQVPVEGARQRRAQPASSTAAWPAGPARTAGDWYAEVAPDAYQALFALVRRRARHPCVAAAARRRPHARRTAPSCAPTSTRGWSRRRAGRLPRRWPSTVGKASADRWRRALAKRTEAEAVLWRLLRIGSAPYFVLGAQRDRIAAAAGDDAVGLAPGLRAQAHGRVGRRRRPAPGPLAGDRPRDRPPARSTPSTATSRSAGATAASASRPRPRPTSTPPTTGSPAT